MRSNFKPLLLSSFFIGFPSYSYLYYKTYKNKNNFEYRVENPLFHDTTRGNPYYGINWGATADSIIEETLDTGDILYIRYDCS